MTASAAPADVAITNGRFFTEAAGGAALGFPIVDGANGDFWTSFQALGGVAALGYPASIPYRSSGFTYQAVQGALLQWRPEVGRAVLANTFEQFTDAGLDPVLYRQYQIPLPVPDDGSGGNYQAAMKIRLSWLTDPGIANRFYANPNPAAFPNWNRDLAIQLYGLPMSRPEAFGPFVSQRFQRITFQRWTQSVAGMPPVGSVVRVLGGDLAKAEGLVPAPARVAQSMGTAADLTVPTGVPTIQPVAESGAGFSAADATAAAGPNQFTLFPCRASAVDPNVDQEYPGQPAPEAGQYLLYGASPVKIEHFNNCWSPSQLLAMHNHRALSDITEVVIHWTDLDYARSAYVLQRGVSVHWLVPRAPNAAEPTLEMVDPRNAAWHAGPLNKGLWEDLDHMLCYPGSPCRPNGNVHSLGFENVGFTTPNSYQVNVMSDILATLIREGYPIKLDRTHVVGHREINSQKPDPGDLDIEYVIDLVKTKLAAGGPAAPATLPVVPPSPPGLADGTSAHPFTFTGSATGRLQGNSGGAFTYYTIAGENGGTITLHFTYTGMAAAPGAVGISVFQGLTNLGTLSPAGGQGDAALTIAPQAGTPISIQVFSYIPQPVTWQLSAG